MGQMNAAQLKGRRTWFFNSYKYYKKHMPAVKNGFWKHQRGYHIGDIRCSSCDKWIDPTGTRYPDEPKEIKILASGKRIHDKRYCTTNSYGGAFFSTVARLSPNRRKRLDEIHRY